MPLIAEAVDATASAARLGLGAIRKTLPPWLFYDAAGSQLFEQITRLPEYYLTRTERALIEQHADGILLGLGCSQTCGQTIVELGAGTASKTGILLRAATRFQQRVLYQPIDVSPSALSEARLLEHDIPGLTVQPQVANYITDPIRIHREPDRRVLALYIGSSIGNFSPAEAAAILAGLRLQLEPGDTLLLGTDLAPGRTKSVAALLAAYDDAARVTAAFNRNILIRLNRELGADFDPSCFTHEARWNAADSRIEMHLVSTCDQAVVLPANDTGPAQTLHFQANETIHTENSYKFTSSSIADLLAAAGFAPDQTFHDPDRLYALTLARAC